MKDISQEKRLQILCMLSKVGSLCVCEIIEQLGIRQNLISHHLKVLKDVGLLVTKREGKNIHYAINQKKFSEFKKTIAHIFNI
ncbi:MAG: metalloregulator ArsR/SmtB family transcription factor [candidate division SR1 bacterium]|nr:metalloregulator ArsR/SmtB family transcription factor [candidate division SR1 bacterium]